jgi:hypothetical protein
MRQLSIPPKNGQAEENPQPLASHVVDASTWLPPLREIKLLQIILNDRLAAEVATRQIKPLGSFHFSDELAGTIFGALSTVLDRHGDPTPQEVAKELQSRACDELTPNKALYNEALKVLPQLADKVPAEVSDCTSEQIRNNVCKLVAEIHRAYENAYPVDSEPATAADDQSAPARKFQILGLAKILSRPRLEYLIEDILLERGTSAITADYGAFKSFNVLDMALCVASGKPWHGRTVKQGAVVYVIAEGAYTTADRVQAWLIRYGLPLPQSLFVIESPAQVSSVLECAQLIREIRELAPRLIIFDTLAKCNIGRDENASDAMGLFTHGMETISRELGCHVMAIHHNNKAGTARGSNALPANVDTHIILEKASAGNIVTFKCDKQKGAPFESFSLIGRVVELAEVDELGRPITSLVFEPTDAIPQRNAEPVSKADITRNRILNTLRDQFPKGALRADLQKACAAHKIVGKSSFHEHLKALEDASLIECDAWGLLQLKDLSDSDESDKSDGAILSDLSGVSLDTGQIGQRATKNGRKSGGVTYGHD